MEENKKEENKPVENKTFMDKYAFLVLLGAIAAVFTILKLIGFPEILSK